MSSKIQINQLLSQAKAIRQASRTSSVDLENYLYYQYIKCTEQSSPLWNCGICSSTKANVPKVFKKAYKKFTQLEKVHFYLMNVKHVDHIVNRNEDSCASRGNRETYEFEASNRKFLMRGGYKLAKWTKVTLEFFDKQKILKISETKEEIDLQLYLIRKSAQKDKDILVFEPMDEITIHEFRIQLDMDDDKRQKINKLWTQAQYDKVKKMLVTDSKKKKLKLMKSNMDISQSNSITARLSNKIETKEERDSFRKQIEEYNQQLESKTQMMCPEQIRDQLISSQFLKTLSSLKDFQEHTSNCYFHKDGRKVRKIFNFPQEIPKQLLLLIISDLRHTRKRKENVTNIKVIKSLPFEQTEIYQEIDHFGEEDIEFVFFRHYFSQDNCEYYFEKSVSIQEFGLPESSQLSKAEIQYCVWRVRSLGNQVELLAEADIKYSKKIKNSQQITNQFIGEFTDYVNERCIQDYSDDESSIETEDFENEYLSKFSESSSFFTVTGSLNEGEQYEDNMIPEQASFTKRHLLKQDFIEQENLKSEGSEGIDFQKNEIAKQGCLNKHKFMMCPFQKNSPVYIFHETGHPMWGTQWVINDQGFLVNHNEEKIRVQSSVLKLVVQKMGRNLLSGKSILNMSLPIQIFGVDSNLQRLAKGYSYAPKFLEQAASMSNPIHRLIQTFCFSLGFSLCYIEMEKPFNPILGETYQGIIDGCPVYGEQISHHPPISSLFMKGRGYTVYGSFEAKVQMGINSASGINEGFNHIKFDGFPGTIKCNGPPGQISGLVYGERKLTLVKKSYIIDQENRLFVEVMWGKNKNGRMGMGKYNDYFSGKVVKIKSGITLEDAGKIKASNYEQELGEIYGRFNDCVYFQSEKLFYLSNDYPFKMEDYLPCLESDSRMRKDIEIRKRREFGPAQQAKEELENLQRRDRKLRDQYK